MMKKMRYVIQLLFLVLFFIVIFKGNMILWLGLFIFSLVGAFVFGRFYCGYICPMNTLMNVTEKLSNKLKWQTKKVPKFLQSKALPWVVLVVMIIIMIVSKKILQKEIPILLILMGLSVLVTLRFEQWVFHNHICPYGALLRLTGNYAKYSTHVDSNKCIGCKKCAAVCPSMAIEMDKEKQVAVINPSICHQCQEICSHVCPKDAIHYGKK